MTAPTDLGRGVWLVTGLLGLGLAGVCGLLPGPADALGALLGSGVTLLNFGGSRGRPSAPWRGPRVAPRLDRGERASPGGLAGVAGLAVTHPGIGLPGLLLSLTLVPVAVILAGLRAARAA